MKKIVVLSVIFVAYQSINLRAADLLPVGEERQSVRDLAKQLESKIPTSRRVSGTKEALATKTQNAIAEQPTSVKRTFWNKITDVARNVGNQIQNLVSPAKPSPITTANISAPSNPTMQPVHTTVEYVNKLPTVQNATAQNITIKNEQVSQLQPSKTKLTSKISQRIKSAARNAQEKIKTTFTRTIQAPKSLSDVATNLAKVKIPKDITSVHDVAKLTDVAQTYQAQFNKIPFSTQPEILSSINE